MPNTKPGTAKDRILELDANGDSSEQIRRRLGVSKLYIQKVLNAAGRHADFSEPIVMPRGGNAAPIADKLNHAATGSDPRSLIDRPIAGRGALTSWRERRRLDRAVLGVTRSLSPYEKRMAYIRNRHAIVKARRSWAEKRVHELGIAPAAQPS